MQKIKRLDKSAVQDNLVIVFACLMFIMQMFIYSSATWDGWHDKIYLTGVFSEAALVFIALFGKRVDKAEVKCLIFYLFWLVVTRYMNNDIRLEKSANHLRIVIACVSVIICGMALDRNKRQKALNIVAVLMSTFFFLLSLAAIYSAVIRADLNLPFGISFEIIKYDATHYFQIMPCSNRNLTSFWLVVSCCLILYLMMVCKKKVLYIPLTAALVTQYVAVGLSMSRGSMIALSIALAMFIVLLVDKKLANGKLEIRIVVLALTAIVSLLVFYKGFAVLCGAVDSLHSVFVPAQETVIMNSADADADTVDTGAAEATEQEKKTDAAFSDSRTKENTLLLGGRVENWLSAIAAIRVEPERLLKGGIIKEYMTLPNLLNQNKLANMHVDYGHMHNYLIDTLLLTGLVGLTLMLFFTLLLVLRMIKVFFAREIALPIKTLTILLAACLVKNMVDTILFNVDDITNFLFCFIAGIFLAYSYELLPAKKPETGTVQPE